MSNPPALSFSTVYHIYTRGTNKTNIFIEERNYEYFLKLYEKYIPPVAYTYAYCLLKNHFHLLIKTKSQQEIDKWAASQDKTRVTPSLQFAHLLNAYAKSINKAYGRVGSLFQHPFGRVVVTDKGHFRNTMLYIHLNPRKHGFINDFRRWPHSSYSLLVSDSPAFLTRPSSLGIFGDLQSFERAHTDYEHNACWLHVELEENLEVA